MEAKTPRCSKCGSTEDADVIEAVGLCVACAERDAIDSLIQDLRVSYGWRDGNVDR
jgi:hypothetical protein